MSQLRIPAAFIRGGTSKAVVLKRADLPTDETEWPALFAQREEPTVLCAALVLQNPDHDFDARATERADSATTHSLVGVRAADEHLADSRFDDRFGAGPRATGEAAGFEGGRDARAAK